MTNEEQIAALADDIDALFRRYMHEFDMTFADVVGTLFMKLHLLCHELIEERDIADLEELEDEEDDENLDI